MTTDSDKVNVPMLEYQSILDSFASQRSGADWDSFTSYLEARWSALYAQGLSALRFSDYRIESYQVGSFHYLYDSATTVEQSAAWWEEKRTDLRIVSVCGHSAVALNPRDQSRVRHAGQDLAYEFGESMSSCSWDKSQYISHSIGGFPDNGLFAQRRDIARGWSKLGRTYRAMERWARLHPGTFVFSRPIYGDGSEHPFFLEYGVLQDGREWWVETFPNRYAYEPFRGFEHAPEWRRRLIPPKALDAHLRIVD